MQTRLLGNTNERVSALGLGCMGMSPVYGTPDEAESFRTLHRFLDAGGTFLDTADVYGAGHNETLVGKAIAGRREGVFLCTKFALGGLSNSPAGVNVNGRPEYVRQAIEASLKRLNVEYVDLYYQHRVDPNTPIEETVGAMADLVKEGKVRYLGLSEASAATIRRAVAVHPIAALQSEYSLWSLELEDEILGVCRELEVGVVPYSPLGRGFLTGQLKNPDDFEEGDWRRTNPRFQGENFQKNLELVRRVEDLAAQKGCTPGQLALAWLLAQGEEIVPIPGTKRVKNLEENLGALDVSLSPAEARQLRELLPSATGERYSAGGMKIVNG